MATKRTLLTYAWTGLILVTGMLAIMGLQAEPAAARDCYWDGTPPICRGRCTGGYERVEVSIEWCVNGYRVRCCEPLGSQSSHQTKARYAAVAIDGRGAWGASLGFTTSQAASADAVRRCGGGACRAVMTGRGRCVGFADSSSGGYWYGNAYGDNAAVVRRIALQGCSGSAPAGTCRVRHVNCI